MMKKKLVRRIYDLRKGINVYHKFNLKKNIIIILVLILYVFVINRKDKDTGIMELCYNFSMSYNNGTVEHLAVVVHRSEIENIEECAKEIIEHCVKNDFDNIKFNYDMKGYPCEIHATVYLDKKDFNNGEYVFKMIYKQELQEPGNMYKYNIIDNPERFSLKIE